MNIPRVTTDLLKSRPEQFCAILNRVIDEINKQN